MWGSVVADIAGKGAGLAGQGITRAVEAASYVGEVNISILHEFTQEFTAVLSLLFPALQQTSAWYSCSSLYSCTVVACEYSSLLNANSGRIMLSRL